MHVVCVCVCACVLVVGGGGGVVGLGFGSVYPQTCAHRMHARTHTHTHSPAHLHIQTAPHNKRYPACRQVSHVPDTALTTPLPRLPHDYNELLHAAIHTPCAKCGSFPKKPALCLCCGALLCAKGSCCSKDDRGECMQHAETYVDSLPVCVREWSVKVDDREECNFVWVGASLPPCGISWR